MIARGFLIDIPREARQELLSKSEPSFESLATRDLSSFLWSSIDNDASKDLDQIEYAKRETGGTRVYVSIADVDWFVHRDSMIDHAAQHNTTSIYTGVLTFPMLPERLSTNLSSLNESVKRLAMVVEMFVLDDGRIADSSIYPAVVENKAQLTYDAVASWLESAEQPAKPLRTDSDIDKRTLAKIHESPELQDQLRSQNRAAESLRQARHEAGALTFHTSEMNPVLSPEGSVVDLEVRRQNVASLLIEDFMIASNQATAKFLDESGVPSLRRVVKTPERWDRITAIAASLGHRLPELPDAKSLEEFLRAERESDPQDFADLSLAIIKLLGRGEYMAKAPGHDVSGHFALAANAYSHSTAPNRRFPDLITQRLLKAALSKSASPYSFEELQTLAVHCTEREDSASKVERLVKKCAAAVLLQSRIGDLFEGVVTGVTNRGTWVRVTHPQVEGKLVETRSQLDVGQRVQVRLSLTDVEHGFIDFALA